MIINGKELAAELKRDIAFQTKEAVNKYGRPPHLAVLLVGDDPASQGYVRSKGKAAEQVGFDHTAVILPESTSEEELLAKIDELNADDGIDAILVQLPLPKHIRKARVIEAISPEKDVDAFHPMNVAAVWKRQSGLYPCTPNGILKILNRGGVKIEGKHAVVIGRSNIVGFPVAKMLLDRDATVTIAHSHTQNLAELTRMADILVVAIGQAKLITADMVKEGAAVVDVGINRDTENGGMCGDVDFEAIKEKASVITPVPGGVGPMTIACLMENTLQCYLNRIK